MGSLSIMTPFFTRWGELGHRELHLFQSMHWWPAISQMRASRKLAGVHQVGLLLHVIVVLLVEAREVVDGLLGLGAEGVYQLGSADLLGHGVPGFVGLFHHPAVDLASA